MPSTHEIAPFDAVELTVAIDKAPAGSRGAVLDLLDKDTAMLEITTMPLEPALDRIVVAPLAKLRRIGQVKTTPRDIAA